MPTLSLVRQSWPMVVITLVVAGLYVWGSAHVYRVLFHDDANIAPVRVRIVSINLDAPVTNVGFDADGFMDIPPTAQELGWFEPGYIPGEQGNAVIAGHLDTESGKPAAFWALNQLKAGDSIDVFYDDGSMRTFTVLRQQTYASNNAPLDDIFGSATGAYLNLITCDGIWDPEEESYEERLVVYAQLR